MTSLSQLFLILSAAIFGAVVWVTALGANLLSRRGQPNERSAWRQLCLPLFSGMLVVAVLGGWSMQEPDPPDERTGAVYSVIAAVAILSFARASVRAIWSLLRARRGVIPVGTAGILRPYVVISDEFRRTADPGVLAAAMLHEAAHVRRRDPLRIWLTQIATDLQWPIPRARRRFDAWLCLLESQRDDEAIAAGANALDLADAVLTAARLQTGAPSDRCAAVAGAGRVGIAWRVRRLLAADRKAAPVSSRSAWYLLSAYGVAIAIGAWLGFAYGEVLLRALPGVGY